jgi:hypothetical protein
MNQRSSSPPSCGYALHDAMDESIRAPDAAVRHRSNQPCSGNLDMSEATVTVDPPAESKPEERAGITFDGNTVDVDLGSPDGGTNGGRFIAIVEFVRFERLLRLLGNFGEQRDHWCLQRIVQ